MWAHLHRCHVLRLGRWTEAEDRRQGTVTKFPQEALNTVVSTVRSMETHQCGQLTWPRVEANEIFVKSFLKMDPSERNIENTEPNGFISPITTTRNLQNMQCCSVKGLLPLDWTLKERAGLCEVTCLTPQMLCGIPRGTSHG